MDFLIVLEPCSDGYGVHVPDLPGCTSGGDTLRESLSNAEEAILLHLDGMLEDGDGLPQPGSEAPADLPAPHVLAVAHVDLNKLEAFNKTTPITVTVPLRTKALLDSAAKRAGISRSQFLSKAALAYIEATK